MVSLVLWLLSLICEIGFSLRLALGRLGLPFPSVLLLTNVVASFLSAGVNCGDVDIGERKMTLVVLFSVGVDASWRLVLFWYDGTQSPGIHCHPILLKGDCESPFLIHCIVIELVSACFLEHKKIFQGFNFICHDTFHYWCRDAHFFYQKITNFVAHLTPLCIQIHSGAFCLSQFKLCKFFVSFEDRNCE